MRLVSTSGNSLVTFSAVIVSAVTIVVVVDVVVVVVVDMLAFADALEPDRSSYV